MNIESPLQTNLQAENFQRQKHASGSNKDIVSSSGMCEIATCPLSPIADDPSTPSSPSLSPPSSQ